MGGPRPTPGLTALLFPDNVEEDLVEWYRSHEVFYDHSRKDYKESAMVNRLWQERAASLKPPWTGVVLKTWFEDSSQNLLGHLLRS